MSLLRRIERDRTPRDDEPRPPSPPRFPRSRTSLFIPLWQHVSGSKLYAVTMTHDKRFIITGGHNGDVLFMDMAGRLLWTGRTEGIINRIALAEPAETFLTGTSQPGCGAHLWHYSGRLLRTYETEGSVLGITITPDARLVAIGSEDKHLYAFDQNGEQLFRHAMDKPVRHVSVTADGELIFASSDDQHVYAFDRTGAQRWRFQTEGRVYAGVRVADEARVLVAGSNDGYVYGLDFEGNERWRFQTGDLVNALAITPDGRYCAAGGRSATAYLLNDQGEVLWSAQTEDAIYGLDLSPDGQYMAIGANDNTLYLFDYQRNQRVLKEPVGGRVYSVALSADAHSIAAASADHKLYLFRYTEVEENGQELTRAESKLHCKLVVGAVRDEYANSSHAGLVRWFSEFEKSLRYQQFDVCRALLDDAHEEDSFGLSEGEKRFTRSLEGAYWLFRGIAHHRQDQVEAARECYEHSKTIQESLNNQDGVGQVIAALSLLPALSADRSGEDPVSPPPDRAELHRLLDEILSKPRVLGMSEKLLEQRIIEAPAPEQHQIILLARQSGIVAPLLKALSAEDRVIRAEASAALTFLEPGPSYDVLGQMLASDEMFVRWQALRMLRARAYDRPDEFKTAKDTVWPVALSPSPESASNPLTRREEALLVKDGGSADDTPWLIACLNDPDADVQIAAAGALGEVGDRRALAALDQVPGRTGFLGTSLQGVANDARASIEKRYPLPTVEQIIFCQHNPVQPGRVQESSLLLPAAEMVYGIVVVDHVEPGAQVQVTWRQGDQVLKEEQRAISSDPDPTFAIVEAAPVMNEPSSRGSASSRFGSRRPGGFGSGDADDSPFSSARRDSPFGRRSRPDEPPPSGFGRAQRSPFARRDDSDDSPRPTFPSRRTGPSPFQREDTPRPGSSFSSRFGRSEPDRPPLARSQPESDHSPGSSWRDRIEDAPARPSFRPRVTHDPIENLDPERSDDNPAASGEGQRPAFSRPSPRPVQRASEETSIPEWLEELANEPEPPRSRLPPPPTRSRTGSPFRPRAEQPDMRDRDRLPPQPAAPSFRSSFNRSMLSQVSRSARILVFELPRPAAGWDIATYQLEAAVDEGQSQRDSFRVIDTIKLMGLEPGVPVPRSTEFHSSHVFMTNTDYIDCMVHLDDAPVHTEVRGKLYSATTGVFLGEAVATAQYQGQQRTQLTWQHAGWKAGFYRIEVEAPSSSGPLSTEIELIDRITVQAITLCHQLAPDGGPVGTGWPFYPGDRCYCVAELGTSPPGVKLQATWYQKNRPVQTAAADPYVTGAGTHQHAVFELVFNNKEDTLTAGHYSVIVSGQDVIRAEQSFEVHPLPAGHRMTQAMRAARQRLSAYLKQHLLDRVLPVLVMVLLLGLGFAAADAVLDYSHNYHDASGNAVLRISRALGQPRWEWGIGWVAAGIAYAVLQTRRERKLAKPFERDIVHIANALLVWVSSALAWYTLSYVLFSAGYLWPTILWGTFGKLLWLSPVVAWFAPLAGLVSVWRRIDQQDEGPFVLAPVIAGASLLAVVIAGWGTALAAGWLLGVIGSIIGELLGVIGVENALGHGFMTVGASAGFFIGLFGLGWYLMRDSIRTFWKDWTTAKREADSPSFNLLTFLIRDDTPPVTVEDGVQVARILLRSVAVMLLAVVALVLVYAEGVRPVLAALYHIPADHMLDQFVSPLVPALTIALFVTVPAMVYALYKRILVPLLNAEQALYIRRIALVFVVLVALALLTVIITSRTSVGADLPPELAVFWTNRVTALVGVGLGALCGVWLIVTMPASLKEMLGDFSLSLDEFIMLIAAALAIIFTPLWLWAALVGLALLLIGGGVEVARRIT